MLPSPHDTSVSLEASGTIGQITFVPTTQTTVVTTTTTTTTSFPPLLIKPPQSLINGNKDYPLASVPTPPSIKRFCFDLDGHPTYFRESDDPNETLVNLQNLVNNIKDGKGTVQVVEKGERRYQTPPISQTSPFISAPEILPTVNGARKRPASPLSNNEGTEKTFSSQKTKRRQTSKPKTEFQASRTRQRVLNNSQMNLPGSLQSAFPNPGGLGASFSRSCDLPALETFPEQATFDAINNSHSEGELSVSLAQARRASLVFTPTENSRTSFPSEKSGESSSSPPVLHSSVREPGELVIPNTSNPLPSLPSPSLSPVTAAMSMGARQSGFFSPMNECDDDEPGSPLALSRASDEICQHESPPIPASDLPEPSIPNIMRLPQMVDTFDTMPQAIKSYLMYQFLRRCDKKTLQFLAEVVNPALKCDFLSRLPTELSLNIIKYLDYRGLTNAAQVSKKWRILIDSDEWTWKRLFESDGYTLSDGELERAVREGWGYQDPEGFLDCERDIQILSTKNLFLPTSPVSNSIRKRKVTRLSLKKSQKQRQDLKFLGKDEFNELINDLSSSEGLAAAVQAASSNPPAGIGLPSLTNLHLYKSLYRRHHIIRRSWVRPDIQPRHISFRGHQRFVVTCLQFDSEKILTGSDDTNINVYDTNTGALLAKLEGHEGGVWALQYHRNTLVSGSTDRTVRVWDIETAECTQIFHGHTSTVRCLQILLPTKISTKDGRVSHLPKQPLIITGSRDSTLKIWKLPNKNDKPYRPANSADPDSQPPNPFLIRTLQGHGHSVRAIAAYGDTLVSGSYDNFVRVWKISTGECIHRLSGHTAKVYSVVLDHKRDRCVSGSMDSCVKVWDLETGALLYTLEGHTSLVGLLDLSHDFLVSAAADASLRIWDPESGQLKHTLSAHTGAITCFQHDGHKVISGSDGTLKMWNIKNGRFIRDLLTNLSGVWQVKFNERRCVAAVQRENLTFIEVLDFGAARDGVSEEQRGRRIIVNSKGQEIDSSEILNDEN